MKTQTRKFGSVFQTGQTGIDEDLWKSSLAKYKAPKFAVELGYDAGTGDPLGNSAALPGAGPGDDRQAQGRGRDQRGALHRHHDDVPR